MSKTMREAQVQLPQKMSLPLYPWPSPSLLQLYHYSKMVCQFFNLHPDLGHKMFQSPSKDAYDLLAYCNPCHIKLSSNIIHYFFKTKYFFIYYSIGNNRNNCIFDINSVRNMNMGVLHLFLYS